MVALTILLSLIVIIHASLGGAEAAPATSQDSLEHHKRDAEDFWNELIEGKGKADDHDHWERIVRRSVDWYDPYYSDDTLHIANVQEYYRYVLEEQGWHDDWKEQELLLERMLGQEYLQLNEQANLQLEDTDSEKHVQKRIPGRYIVMLDSTADEYTLDRTIEILDQAHRESEGRIRADHITPMRNLGTGFTATMNSKTVELVS